LLGAEVKLSAPPATQRFLFFAPANRFFNVKTRPMAFFLIFVTFFADFCNKPAVAASVLMEEQ